MPIYSARPDQVVKALKNVYNIALNKLKGKELELVLAILPDNNGPLYGKCHLLISLHIYLPFELLHIFSDITLYIFKAI